MIILLCLHFIGQFSVFIEFKKLYISFFVITNITIFQLKLWINDLKKQTSRLNNNFVEKLKIFSCFLLKFYYIYKSKVRTYNVRTYQIRALDIFICLRSNRHYFTIIILVTSNFRFKSYPNQEFYIGLVSKLVQIRDFIG